MNKESLRTASLDQRLIRSGTDTSIRLKTSAGNEWGADSTGHCLIGSDGNEEHVYFNGTTVISTINGVVTFTIDNVVRGIKRNASTLTDADASMKRDNTVGARVRFVLHSSSILEFLSASGDNVITGSITFDNLSYPPFIPPVYTETERDALTLDGKPAIIFNSTTGVYEGYVGGIWVPFEIGTPISYATTSSAGILQIATDQQKIDMDATDSVSGAPLIIDPSDTKRTLHPSNVNSKDTLEVGKGTSGNRTSRVRLYADDTNTDGGLEIRRVSGANGSSVIEHRGTGYLRLDAGTSYIIEDNPEQMRSSTILSSFTAGESLVAGRWVALDDDGTLKHAQPNDPVLWNTIGVVVTSASSGSVAYVNESPVINIAGITNLSPQPWYLDSNGQMTATTPAINNPNIIPVCLGCDNGASSPSNRRFVKNVKRLPRTLAVKARHTFVSGNQVVYAYDLPTGFNFSKIHVFAGESVSDQGVSKYSIFTRDALNAGTGATDENGLWGLLTPSFSSGNERTIFGMKTTADSAVPVTIWIYSGYRIAFEYIITNIAGAFPTHMDYQLLIDELV